MQKNKQTNKQNIKKQKTKNEKQKNPRARGRASESFVWTLIDNGKWASQIVRLKAIVRT